MRRLLTIASLVLVAGMMVMPTALAQGDGGTGREGPPLAASPTDGPTAAAGDQYGQDPTAGTGGLPQTGGVGLALLVLALLTGGVVGFAISRRSSGDG